MKKLYLSDVDRKIGGVCGGMGEYFDKDPTLIRILFILVILFSFGFGLLAYLAMWLIVPKKPDGLHGGHNQGGTYGRQS